MLYVSSKGDGDTIWRAAGSGATQLWSEAGARVVGGPDIAGDGRRVTFLIEQNRKTLLYVVNADGTNARVVSASLPLRGSPVWSPDGKSITCAVLIAGTPNLYSFPLDGGPVPLNHKYALDPTWSPTGDVLLYTGADIGTTYRMEAMTAAGLPAAIPDVNLTRGARRVRFLDRRSVVVMRGDIQHKDLWLIDLESGAERALTDLPRDFVVRDFDVSVDGREIMIERVEEQSDVVLIDLAPQS